ncbi:hypothetical protein FBU31_000787, partial [Coemansia sp. 'formosensis']
LAVREFICALGLYGCCLLAAVIWMFRWRARVSDLKDIDEPSYPGTSRFLRQLRVNEANLRVLRSTGGSDDTDDDTDTDEPSIPIEATDADDDGTCSNNSRGNEIISPRAPDENMRPIGSDTGANDSKDGNSAVATKPRDQMVEGNSGHSSKRLAHSFGYGLDSKSCANKVAGSDGQDYKPLDASGRKYAKRGCTNSAETSRPRKRQCVRSGAGNVATAGTNMQAKVNPSIPPIVNGMLPSVVDGTLQLVVEGTLPSVVDSILRPMVNDTLQPVVKGMPLPVVDSDMRPVVHTAMRPEDDVDMLSEYDVDMQPPHADYAGLPQAINAGLPEDDYAGPPEDDCAGPPEANKIIQREARDPALFEAPVASAATQLADDNNSQAGVCNSAQPGAPVASAASSMREPTFAYTAWLAVSYTAQSGIDDSAQPGAPVAPAAFTPEQAPVVEGPRSNAADSVAVRSTVQPQETRSSSSQKGKEPNRAPVSDFIAKRLMREAANAIDDVSINGTGCTKRKQSSGYAGDGNSHGIGSSNWHKMRCSDTVNTERPKKKAKGSMRARRSGPPPRKAEQRDEPPSGDVGAVESAKPEKARRTDKAAQSKKPRTEKATQSNKPRAEMATQSKRSRAEEDSTDTSAEGTRKQCTKRSQGFDNWGLIDPYTNPEYGKSSGPSNSNTGYVKRTKPIDYSCWGSRYNPGATADAGRQPEAPCSSESHVGVKWNTDPDKRIYSLVNREIIIDMPDDWASSLASYPGYKDTSTSSRKPDKPNSPNMNATEPPSADSDSVAGVPDTDLGDSK